MENVQISQMSVLGPQAVRQMDREPYETRAANFSGFIREQLAGGLPLMREVHSAADTRVLVRDYASGETQEMVMFGSNNYLGLANHPEVRPRVDALVSRFGMGLGGPPMLNGTTALHRQLERELAEFKGTEDSLLFSSGFGAGFGLITAIVGKRDAVILDALAHTSLKEGARVSKGTTYGFPHNDIDGLEAALQRATADGALSKFVVVEGVYSMDGDVPPLDRIYEVTKRHDALLILDDAHGTGVVGHTGRGAAEVYDLEGKIDFVIGTFSKALASCGGFVAASRQTTDYLRFFAKSFFFSAALPPVLVAHILSNLSILRETPALRENLMRNVAYLKDGFGSIGIETSSDSAILPICLPPGTPLRRLARRIDRAGVFVNHIEHPAVPADKERFRVSVMSQHTRADMDKLLCTFEEIFKDEGLI